MIIQPPNTNLIINADCLTALRELPDNSVDSIVTDPPYGLSFMGKKWDYEVTSIEIWKECLRVLKHGGYLLSFSGTRTYHRICIGIEDAGFEIRDMISWIYGSGFPKSYNIEKGINKLLTQGSASWNGTGDCSNGGLGYAKMQHQQEYRDKDYSNKHKDKTEITEPETIKFKGYGTALKPACEPIVVARKPLSEKNVALNVLKWGTGGINIDGCRIGSEIVNTHSRGNNGAFPKRPNEKTVEESGRSSDQRNIDSSERQGRFPANIILDEEAGQMLDEQSGIGISNKRKNGQDYNLVSSNINLGGGNKNHEYTDKGGASRFFYCAKAGKKERNMGCEDMEDKPIDIQQPHNSKDLEERYKMTSKNNHPTVKPIKLMQYLVRLVTPKGGVCLDPFLGSGTTAIACIKEDMNYIGIEREEDYVKIANARIKAVEDSHKQ